MRLNYILEIKQKRRKGLCFHCDEKISPGNLSKNKHVQVMVMLDDDKKGSKGQPEAEVVRWHNSP